jgi:predicted DNA-binding protein
MTEDRALTIRFPVDLYEQLVAQAKREDRTVASLLRQIARAYLEGRP